MLPPESAFCSNHVRKSHLFVRFESAFETRVFENKHGRNSVYALTTFDDADFGLKS